MDSSALTWEGLFAILFILSYHMVWLQKHYWKTTFKQQIKLHDNIKK